MEREKSFESRWQAVLFYAVYVLLFGLMLLGVFYWFYTNDVSLISKSDTFRQHLKAVAYYAKWLRGIVHDIAVEHRFSFDTFSMGMGYGSDIYSTLQYYAIGDLLLIPSVFVPDRYIYLFFEVVMLLRPFLAGITFSALVFYVRPRASKISVLAGMFTYSFCSFFFFLGIWHPFFANPLIYFPLLLLGAEKIIRENKAKFFAISIFLAGCNNFFFFYILICLTIVYAIIRIAFTCKNDFRKWGALLSKFVISGLIGTLMSMVILLPVIVAFPDNPRFSIGITFSLFYDGDYYQQLIRNFFSFVYHGYYDTEIGTHGIALIALFMLFIKAFTEVLKKKEKKAFQLFVMFLVMVLFVCLPAAGYALTAFEFLINRWSFVFALFAAFILVDCWDDIFSMEKIRILLMIVISALFVIICRFNNVLLYENAIDELGIAGAGLIVAVISSIVVLLINDKNRKAVIITTKAAECVMAGLIFFGIIVNAYYAYAPEKGNMVGDYLDEVTPDSMHVLLESTEVQVIKEAAEMNAVDPDGFYRYSGRDLQWNASLIEGVSSTQFYWSFANGVVSDFFMDMGINDQQSFAYYALDDRAILNSLMGVKYYSLRYNTEEENRFVPYGFYHLYDKYNFALFENSHPLSLGYAYYNVIPRADYEEMSPVNRQEALLYGVVLDKDDNSYPVAEPKYSLVNVPYEITTEGNVSFGENKIVAENGSALHIRFDGVENSETYLWLGNLHVNSENDYPMMEAECFSDQDFVTLKQICYKTEQNQFYSGWHDFFVNMGYSGKKIDEIVLHFTASGEYNFDEFGVYCQPMANYDKQIEVLSQDMLYNIELYKNPISYASNKISGEIDMSDDGILCITIPYSKGWRAYVDGKKTDISRANTMCMGLKLPEGHHEIVLKYHTPGLLAGFILSISGIVLLIILSLYEKKHYNQPD